MIKKIREACDIIEQSEIENKMIGFSVDTTGERSKVKVQLRETKTVYFVAQAIDKDVHIQDDRSEVYPYQFSTEINDVIFFSLSGRAEAEEWISKTQPIQA